MDAHELVRKAGRDWRYPAAVAVMLFMLAFLLATFAANTSWRDSRHQVALFQEQTSCRSKLNSDVQSARSNVEAIDGQIVATIGLTFADALSAPLSEDRRAQLQGIFHDQLAARESLQRIMDDQLKRLEQAPALCPG